MTWWDAFVQWVIIVAIVVSFLSALAFCVSYAVFFDWRKNAAGRSLLYAFSALVALSALGFLNGWLGEDYPAREPLRAVVWCAVAVGCVRLLWTLWARRRSRVGAEVIEQRPRREPRHSEGNDA